jgi:hypothetical protein
MVDDNSKEQVLSLYRVYVDNIVFIKQQMWRMIYYCLVLFGVLFYLADYFDKKKKLGHIIFDLPCNINFYFFSWTSVSVATVLLLFACIVVVIGLCFLRNFSYNLQAERVGLANIKYWYFDTWLRYIVYSSLKRIDEQEILKRMEEECSLWKDKLFFFIFAFVIIGALAVVVFRLYYKFPQSICPYLSNSLIYC